MTKQLSTEEVRDQLEIDKDQLDHELMAQPELVYDVNMRRADAISARDSYKLDLEELEAEVFDRLRKGDAKMQVTAVKALVDSDPDVIAARRKMLKLTDAARRWEVCTESITARGYALHKLVDMALVQSAAIAGQSEKEDRRSAADAAVQEALRERRQRRKL